MLDLKEKLLNQWIEYSGGSRPKANMIMFEGGDQPKLNIRYVFDWETNEIITMSFDLENGDFDNLLKELLAKGQSSLIKTDDKQKLFFEWKMSGDHILIRMDAQAYAGLEGKTRYILKDFRDLIIEQSVG